MHLRMLVVLVVSLLPATAPPAYCSKDEEEFVRHSLSRHSTPVHDLILTVLEVLSTPLVRSNSRRSTPASSYRLQYSNSLVLVLVVRGSGSTYY